MDKKYLTAPCGLDCFNCPLFENNITDETKENMSKQLNTTPEDVICKGCRTEEGRCKFLHNCATWKCVADKGLSFCYECDKFPFDYYMPSYKGAQYPHNIKVYNLCRIKVVGLDAWIAEACQIRVRYYNGRFVAGKGPIINK